MKYFITFTLFVLTCFAHASPLAKVEPKIWKNLEVDGTTNILVTFKKANTKAAIARFHSLRLTGRDDKLNAQYSILKDHADRVQSNVISMLKKMEAGKKHVVSQLWISAELIVRNVDSEVTVELANHPDVQNLTAEFFLSLPRVSNVINSELNAIRSGVLQIRADQVWALGTDGTGVTVAAIDTGVRSTHIDLRGNYRGNVSGILNHNYNWFDATYTAKTAPADGNGHGTHVTGTMCGQNGIGVAPGAKWIHCKGCASSSCSSTDVIECGNWIACPKDINNQNEDCTKAPHIVNNSWAFSAGNSFFDAIIAAWLNVNIIPFFAAGNSGPNCNTIMSPADRIGSFAVGSVSNTNVLSTFSSVGPTNDNRIKPDIAAPGENIESASSNSNTGYVIMSGTSMATPHAVGLAALIISKNTTYTVDSVKKALTCGAVVVTTANQVCGGISDSVIPNNHFGFGRIDAVNSISTACINPTT